MTAPGKQVSIRVHSGIGLEVAYAAGTGKSVSVWVSIRVHSGIGLEATTPALALRLSALFQSAFTAA